MADLTLEVAASHRLAPHQTGHSKYEEDEPRTAGGPGSGNFGHAGRPGEIGGSAGAGPASYTVDRRVTSSAKFDKALDHVKTERPDLFKPRIHIVLEPRGMKGGGSGKAHGYARRNFVVKDGKPVRDDNGELVRSGSYTVAIAASRASTADYIKTLVHELEHVQQWERGEKPHEGGAMGAGSEAAAKFKYPRTAGGPGSGNFGHSGRPGQIGGSSSDDGGSKHDRFEQGQPIIQVPAYRGGVGEHSAAVTYYSTNREMAESYVEMSNDRFGSGGSLHAKTITIAKPAPEDVVMEEARAVGIDNGFYTPGSVFDAELHGQDVVDALVANLQKQGYDGAVLEDIAYGREIEAQALIVFNKRRAAGGPGSGNFGHAGRPGQVGGSSSEAGAASTVATSEPKIYRTRDDIKEISGGRWQWKNEGFLIHGVPLEKANLPDTLYHVTTNAKAVEATGHLRGQFSDGGLGGGQEEGVSFTSSKDDAVVIQRELKRAVEIARGEHSVESIARFAREDEKTAGLPEGTLNDAVKNATQMWDGNIDAKSQGERIYGTPEKQQSLLDDTFKSYLMSRDMAAKKLGKQDQLKNPILFGDQKKLRLIDPENIRTLHVPTANISDKALITSGSDSFLKEVRVFADVPVKDMRVAGGPGSGNFGHAGRPGEQGGSSSKQATNYVDSDLRKREIDRIDALVENHSGGPGDREYDALAHISTALEQAHDLPLSQKKDWRFAYVLADDKIVAAGSMYRTSKTTAEVKNVGSVEKGSGKLVMEELTRRARDWGVKEIQLVSTARKFYESLGFKLDGNKMVLKTLGGPGSGNFGHSGRPGQVGGSSSEGSAGAPKTETMKELVSRIRADDHSPFLLNVQRQHFEELGYTPAEFEEFRERLDGHTRDATMAAADKDIAENLGKDTRFGQFLKDRIDAEEQIITARAAKAEEWYKSEVQKARDDYALDKRMGISMYNPEYDGEEEAWFSYYYHLAEKRQTADEMKDPVFYRRAALGKDVLSTSSSPGGAQTQWIGHEPGSEDAPTIEPTHKWTLSEMRDFGYRPVAGASSLFGYVGENEILFLKDPNITPKKTFDKKSGRIKQLGGPGSGNFGHSGRPGQVGGSSSDDAPKPPEGRSWLNGEGVEDGDVADAAIAWTEHRYPKAEITKRKAVGLESEDRVYKGTVDGLVVRTDIPNTDSIGATFYHENEYDELSGIREVSVADFDIQPYHAKDDEQRVDELAKEIKESGEITPLIVIMDAWRIPYVLEGNHRLKALKKLGKTRFPAVVIVDHRKQKDPPEGYKALGHAGSDAGSLAPEVNGWDSESGVAAEKALGGPGSGNFGHAGRPGQIGGSESETVTVFHGTIDRALKSIAEKGIVPLGGNGADSTKYGMEKMQIGDRKVSIYVTRNLEEASNYAAMVRSRNEGTRPVILEITLPKGALVPDEASEGVSKDAFRFKGTIPPDHIRVVEHDFGRYIGSKPLLAAAAGEGRKIFFVLLVDDEEPRTAGGPGSGNFGHSGRPGQVGGSGDGGGADHQKLGKELEESSAYHEGFYYYPKDRAQEIADKLPGSRLVRWRGGYAVERSGSKLGPEGFANEHTDPRTKYPDAPQAKVSKTDVEEAFENLRKSGRLNPDGTVSIYHTTLSDTADILREGLIPAKESAPGQDWQAEHSKYATYFHLDREPAERDAENGGGDIIEARIPVTREMLQRILPDEDTSSDPNDGPKIFSNGGGAIAIVGGLDPSMLKVRKRRTLGGPGSGNFGHAGRPGEVGGSSSEGGGTLRDRSEMSIEELSSTPVTEADMSRVERRTHDMAAEMGFDAKRINIVNKEARVFTVGSKTFSEAGHYNPADREVEVNARMVADPRMSVTQGLVAHEISHAIFHDLRDEMKEESDTIAAMSSEEFSVYFKASGYPRPEKDAELREMFPVSHLFARTIGGTVLDPEVERGDTTTRSKMIEENGHSRYAKAYWELDAVTKHGGLELAINETLAEVTRYQMVPVGWAEPKAPKGLWKELAQGMREVHADMVKKREQHK